MTLADSEAAAPITGRCYCGAMTIEAHEWPQTVTYCHCSDCRRVTGAPVAAFAAFDDSAVTVAPDEGQKVSITPGVERSFCRHCGSPLTGRYDYLPGQVYISLGLLDQANDLAPQMHAHASQRLCWLHIDDDLERATSSARDQLAGDRS